MTTSDGNWSRVGLMVLGMIVGVIAGISLCRTSNRVQATAAPPSPPTVLTSAATDSEDAADIDALKLENEKLKSNAAHYAHLEWENDEALRKAHDEVRVAYLTGMNLGAAQATTLSYAHRIAKGETVDKDDVHQIKTMANFYRVSDLGDVEVVENLIDAITLVENKNNQLWADKTK